MHVTADGKMDFSKFTTIAEANLTAGLQSPAQGRPDSTQAGCQDRKIQYSLSYDSSYSSSKTHPIEILVNTLEFLHVLGRIDLSHPSLRQRKVRAPEAPESGDRSEAKQGQQNMKKYEDGSQQASKSVVSSSKVEKVLISSDPRSDRMLTLSPPSTNLLPPDLVSGMLLVHGGNDCGPRKPSEEAAL
ncbi:hypothetical protein BDZ89DRAFT_1047498 [Hymenopellis radicata]|nr:hypothetical protein BDZ89DRAFT_1047498 [Hymenopellis radicata]